MRFVNQKKVGTAVLIMTALAVAGCSSRSVDSGPKGLQARNGKTSGKEYFSESAYGVKASPRVTNKLTNLPRGGGRDQTGKPYQVKGKWYYPKEEPGYRKRGGASWYGDAFHGRLTANGEIYDMTHLTAAHPTMPLPSYARVTNAKNGNSVIVRVNDRGPYADGRIIDLSRKAAEMLDYTHDGVATVQVEYVGRAPLDGHDEKYLMASYIPGNGKPDPSVGMPTGTMIAMRGNTPSEARKPTPFEAPAADQHYLTLPDNAPILPEPNSRVALASMSYAADQAAAAAKPFDGMLAAEPGAGWKAAKEQYIVLGSFNSEKRAKAISDKLAAFGKVEAQRANGLISLSLVPARQGEIDRVLQAAWRAGAKDAMTVRP